MPQASASRRVRVATAFVRHGGSYLALRRSESVSTMRGLWSAVSGTIHAGEGAPERALAEIREEAGIEERSLSLAASTPPLLVSSERHAGGPWEVHAFLFDSETRSVRLNWESSEYRWVGEAELRKLDTVPRLAETLSGLLRRARRPRARTRAAAGA